MTEKKEKEILTDDDLKEELTEEQYSNYFKILERYGEAEAFAFLPTLSHKYNKTDESEAYSQLNKRIKELRLENGLTQTEVANALEVSHREYWRYEQDGYSPNILKIAQVAIFYNVSIDWLSGFLDIKKPFVPNTEIYESTSVNGYCLKDMKAAKARGEKYHPDKWMPDDEDDEYEYTESEEQTD